MCSLDPGEKILAGVQTGHGLSWQSGGSGRLLTGKGSLQWGMDRSVAGGVHLCCGSCASLFTSLVQGCGG